jgi:hypothetical protein
MCIGYNHDTKILFCVVSLFKKIILLKNKIPLMQFLIENDFHKIKLHFMKSNHYKVIAKINGIKGHFVLDTGASTTFVDRNLKEKFKLFSEESQIKASGAGPDKIDAFVSHNNQLKFGEWSLKKCTIALIDLDPINTAFANANLLAVDGIIGADVLKKGKAIIDYDKNYLYLK